MAVAMSSVLQTKYVVAAPTSGFGIASSENCWAVVVPPRSPYVQPAAFTVSTSDAMLKSVRCGADRVFVRNVHWLHALVAATIIVSFGPSMSRAATSTAYDTDIVEPLVDSGRLTFSAEASDEQPISTANSNGFAISCGANSPKVKAPAASTAPTKSRAGMGRSFISPAGGTPSGDNAAAKEESADGFTTPATGWSRFGLE